jgi:hypothetical protein
MSKYYFRVKLELCNCIHDPCICHPAKSHDVENREFEIDAPNEWQAVQSLEAHLPHNTLTATILKSLPGGKPQHLILEESGAPRLFALEETAVS